MFTRIVILALAIQASLADLSLNAPILDALAAHHNIAVVDHTYTEGLQQALGANVAVHNEPIHFKTGYVGTLSHPMGTGQIIGKHVETFALGQQAVKAQAQAKVAHVVSHPVQTQVMHQSVQVPVQTMQTVQVPSVSYQTVQVPVHIQKEIVEVEKPVPVPHPVAVEAAPKPYVKEAVYARPFQRSQKYVKTRITPVEEMTIDAPATTTTTTEAPIIGQVQHVDLTEENLYFANKKRKIVTRFIKIEEMYEAESFEEVGIFYDVGPSTDDDFELKVTRIFEVDQPLLIKNETVTSRVSYLRSPAHIINEYMNGKLEHSYYAGNPHSLFNGRNASDAHFHRFHSYGSSFGSGFMHSPSFGIKSPDYHKYTQFMNGREVEIEERTTVLPGGHALFIEKRIRALGDHSPFPESIEAVPSFETSIQNGKEVLLFTLTYDSTKKMVHTKYGIAASQSFGSEFSSFLNEFKKNIPSRGVMYDRVKRSVQKVESNVHSRKRRDASEKDVKDAEKKTGPVRNRRAPLSQIEYHNKIYKLKAVMPLKGLNPGGYIYKSDDGHEIKVEEETITNIEGGPKNEYLRYSQVYVPRQKVKYEVSGLLGQPSESFLHGLGSYFGNYQGYPLYDNLFEQGSSYKINNPFLSI